MHFGTSAAVLPVTPQKQIVLTREYRHGLGRIVHSLPGGTARNGESAEACARRELMEETGYSFEDDQTELLAHMYANPTGARTRIWWYLARNVRKTGVPKVDPAEVIETRLVTPRELLALIHDGSFAVQGQVAAAYMALERLGYLSLSL